MPESYSLITLGVFVAANFLAASSGAIFKPGDWYKSLTKPGWTPPNWAFPVVWTTLFLMNAVAGWLVWEASPPNDLLIFTAYGLSLAINAGWSALFFGMRRMDLSLVDVSALWLSIALVMALFAGVNMLASILLLPYLAWVSLAGILNFRMLQLNPRQSKGA
ncbi:MAG: TspO/MBR family protein [Pseudomonadota bacterium]